MELKEMLGESYKEGMTVEEVAEAVKGLNLVDPSALPPSVSKETFDKTASELAALKKQAKERMSAEEAAQAKQQEVLDQLSALQQENTRMRQEKTFLSAGYDAGTAAKLAEYVVEGNTEEFVKVQTAWLAEQKKTIYAQTKEELLKATPSVNTGAAPPDAHPDVDLAASLAKSRAASMGNQQDILKNYM